MGKNTLVMLAVVFAVIVAQQKPNDLEFVTWMESTYGIQCLDYNCATFEIESAEGEEPILMQTQEGSYSPGTFVMEVDREYWNSEDSSYVLDIKVKGFLGEFTVEEETISKIPKE